MKRRTFILLAAVGVAAGLALRLRADPRARQVRLIQTRLRELSVALSFTDKDPPFARLSYAERVTRFFDDPVDLDLAIGPYVAAESVHRTRLPEGLAGLRLNNRGLDVQFIDITVDLPDEALDPATAAPRASAHLTSKIFFAGERDYWVQEFRLALVRRQGVWLVRSVATVRTMEH